MEYITNFGEYLSENGKADKTVESYTGDVKGFIRFLAERDLIFEGTLNRFAIISYKNSLMEKNYAPTTINKKLNSIQSFNDFLIDRGDMTELVLNLGRDRIKIGRGSEKPLEVLSPTVVDTLLFHLETRAKHLRDKVLVHLLLYTGVRVSEFVAIKIRDIDFLAH